MKLNWNFWRGGGLNKKPSVGEVWIFFLQLHNHTPLVHSAMLSLCSWSMAYIPNINIVAMLEYAEQNFDLNQTFAKHVLTFDILKTNIVEVEVEV